MSDPVRRTLLVVTGKQGFEISDPVCRTLLVVLCAKYVILEPFAPSLNGTITSAIAVALGIFTYWAIKPEEA